MTFPRSRRPRTAVATNHEAANVTACVERPLQRRLPALVFDSGDALPFISNPQLGAAGSVLARMWDFGIDLTHLQRLFHKLPVDFIRGLNKVCSAMAVVAQHAAQEASKVPHALQISETVQDSTLASELVESAMAEMNGKSGVWRRLFCPVTGHRKRFFSTPSYFNSMVGCHPEEFMTRMQNRELPLYQSEVDFLIFICDQMATARQTTTRRVYRHRFKPGSCVFFQILTMRTFDSCGRLTQIEHSFEALSVPQLDQILQKEPEIVHVTHMGVDPSYSDAGARVDAATLVANSDNDYTRGTVANMVHTSRGRAILQDIIVKLCADFAPVVARADALVKASGPWQLGDDIHDVRHVFLPHAAQSQSAAQHQSPCTGQHASQMTVAGQDLGHHESKQASLDVDCSSRGACHSSGPLHAEERRSGVGGGGGGNGGGEGGGFGGAKDGTSWELRSHLLAMHGGALTSPGPPAHGFICDPLYTPGSPWADPFVDPCAGD
eukprot:Tamp_11335.p1 GENE.Tamp_11335~~Tamp_11335.p1  ORF type:complete len:494 (+),score=62.69 Tamp_11335:402-1883(+)